MANEQRTVEVKFIFGDDGTMRIVDTAGNKLVDFGKKADEAGKQVTSSLTRAEAAATKLGNVSSVATVAGLDRVAGAASRVEVALGVAGTVGAGLGLLIAGGAVAGAAALAKLGKDAIDNADRLNELSAKTGIAVEILSGLRLAGENAGIGVEELATGIGFLNRKIAEGDPLLRQLGITAQDPYQAFLQLSDLFQSLPDGAVKAKLAWETAGRGGGEFTAMLSQGSAAIKDQVAQAERLGVAIGSKLAKDSDELNDTLHILGQTFRGIGNDVAEAVLPGLIDGAKSTLEWTEENREWIATGIAEHIKNAGQAAREAAKAYREARTAAQEWAAEHPNAVRAAQSVLPVPLPFGMSEAAASGAPDRRHEVTGPDAHLGPRSSMASAVAPYSSPGGGIGLGATYWSAADLEFSRIDQAAAKAKQVEDEARKREEDRVRGLLADRDKEDRGAKAAAAEFERQVEAERRAAEESAKGFADAAKTRYEAAKTAAEAELKYLQANKGSVDEQLAAYDKLQRIEAAYLRMEEHRLDLAIKLHDPQDVTEGQLAAMRAELEKIHTLQGMLPGQAAQYKQKITESAAAASDFASTFAESFADAVPQAMQAMLSRDKDFGLGDLFISIGKQSAANYVGAFAHTMEDQLASLFRGVTSQVDAALQDTRSGVSRAGEAISATLRNTPFGDLIGLAATGSGDIVVTPVAGGGTQISYGDGYGASIPDTAGPYSSINGGVGTGADATNTGNYGSGATSGAAAAGAGGGAAAAGAAAAIIMIAAGTEHAIGVYNDRKSDLGVDQAMLFKEMGRGAFQSVGLPGFLNTIFGPENPAVGSFLRAIGAFQPATFEDQLGKSINRLYDEADVARSASFKNNVLNRELDTLRTQNARFDPDIAKAINGSEAPERFRDPLGTFGRLLYGSENFANRFFANTVTNSARALGLNEEQTQRQIEQLADKSGLTLTSGVKELGDLFAKGKYTQDEYNQGVNDLVTLLSRRLPAGVDAAALAFSNLETQQQGTIVNTEKFSEALERQTRLFGALETAIEQANMVGLSSFLAGGTQRDVASQITESITQSLVATAAGTIMEDMRPQFEAARDAWGEAISSGSAAGFSRARTLMDQFIADALESSEDLRDLLKPLLDSIQTRSALLGQATQLRFDADGSRANAEGAQAQIDALRLGRLSPRRQLMFERNRLADIDSRIAALRVDGVDSSEFGEYGRLLSDKQGIATFLAQNGGRRGSMEAERILGDVKLGWEELAPLQERQANAIERNIEATLGLTQAITNAFGGGGLGDISNAAGQATGRGLLAAQVRDEALGGDDYTITDAIQTYLSNSRPQRATALSEGGVTVVLNIEGAADYGPEDWMRAARDLLVPTLQQYRDVAAGVRQEINT